MAVAHLCRITPSGSLYDEFDFCHTRALVKPICRGRPLCGGLEAAASVSPKWPNLPARAREHLAKAGRVSVFFRRGLRSSAHPALGPRSRLAGRLGTPAPPGDEAADLIGPPLRPHQPISAGTCTRSEGQHGPAGVRSPGHLRQSGQVHRTRATRSAWGAGQGIPVIRPISGSENQPLRETTS